MNTPPDPNEHETLQDPGWYEALRALNLFVDSRGTADVGRRVRVHGIDLGVWVGDRREDYWNGALASAQIDELEQISSWSWGDPRTITWRHVFDALLRSSVRTGTSLIARESDVDGIDLRSWTAEQRDAFARGDLWPSRRELLESIPGWEWDAEQVRWQQGVAAATEYVRQNGGLEGARRETVVGDFRLGHWIQRCREDYRAGTLPMARVDALAALPGWKWGRHEHAWERGVAALQRHIAITGTATPKQRQIVDGVRLGIWVNERRAEYKKGSLSAERAALLESFPGWQWNPLADRWQFGLSVLKEYVDQMGHANPAGNEEHNGFALGEWVRAQRAAKFKDRLPIERSSQLEALPGWRWKARTSDSDGYRHS